MFRKSSSAVAAEDEHLLHGFLLDLLYLHVSHVEVACVLFKTALASSLTCEAEDGTEIVLRTVVLKDSEGKTITADAFPVGSKINARGVVDVFNGVYQLKIFSANDITFVN